jgi:hypothetical protein
MTLQTQGCNQNKKCINGSVGIKLLRKRKICSLIFPITFDRLQLIRVHFAFANAGMFLKQHTSQWLLRYLGFWQRERQRFLKRAILFSHIL